MATFELSSGHRVPAIGFGTWKSEKTVVANAVRAALDAGYRHIDCAYIYENEAEIGEVFSEYFDKKVKREDVFVTSKLWNTAHRKDDVRKACENTLKNLQLDYLDLYLVHWPVAFDPSDGEDFPRNPDGTMKVLDVPIEETWKEMEKLVDDGLVRSIGISNFNVGKVEEVLKIARIPPAMNQVELHPYLPQKELLEFCTKNKIVLTAYSPLGAKSYPFLYGEEKIPDLMEDETVLEVSNKCEMTPAQVLLRWNIQRGVVVIPKSVHENRIRENFEAASKQIPEEEMEKLNRIQTRFRYNETKLFWKLDVFEDSE